MNGPQMTSKDLCSDLIGAIDQGTGSTRFLVFASDTAEIITYHQIETKQLFPRAGWVEQDAVEILESVLQCIDKTVKKLQEFEIDPNKIKAIGVTNQRETTVVWNKYTGRPLHNAIVWQDGRTADIVNELSSRRGAKAVKEKCGLPLNSYFSAVKLKWLIQNVPSVKKAIDKNECLFGTIDSWLIWNLTGGASQNGVHVTDVTNASRTMLMDIRTFKWDPWLCNFFDIPMDILPKICSCSEILGYLTHHPDQILSGIPISGCVGDQSAALIGQLCFQPGSAKNTCGTGCFLLCNTGRVPVWSNHGLLTTVGYQLGPDSPVIYALEGSVAIAGALITWIRDNLGIVSDSSHVESLAKSVGSTHGVYFVPAFSGLYAPYWQPTARGTICGLSQFSTKAHIACAALEAVCFQTKEIVDVMNLESGFPLERLQMDGGMTNSNLLMQLQADILGIPIILPSMSETTALGAAMAAGHAIGVWNIESTISSDVTTEIFVPAITDSEREIRYATWKKAIKRSMHWDEKDKPNISTLAQSLPGGIFLFTTFAILLLAEKLNK